MTPLQHHLLALILSCLFSILLGIFVWLKNPKRWLNQLFALHSLAVAAWSVTEILSALLPIPPKTAMFWLRLEHIPVFLLPPLFLHLVVVMLELKHVSRIIQFGYFLSFIFICWIPSPLLIAGQAHKFYMHFWMIPGPLYWLAIIFFWTYVNLSVWYLWKAFRKASGIKRLQIKYFLIGTTLAYLGGAFSDFLVVYNIYIPWLTPYGLYLVPIYKLLTAYAIVQHQLLDIRVVIRKSLIYSILITLLTIGYFALIYGIERIFQISLGYHSVWISLTAFALMALLFQPLKISSQRLVDWLFFKVPQEELMKRMERLEEQALQTEKFKAVSTLAAGMAHEIKNPLTALQTFAEFIPEKRNDPAFIDDLHQMLLSETERIRGIAQDLMDFAKPKPPELKKTDLAPLIHSTLHLLSKDLTKQRIKWTINCHHNGVSFYADADQLRQVLINLVQNAADSMPKGGNLTLATTINNNYLELTVSDTGHGIPKDLLPKIFDPFVTTKSNGNGLGLAMVYSMVQAHRGTISVESTIKKGTTFTIKLPL